jgi:ribosomal protein S15P/S13E
MAKIIQVDADQLDEEIQKILQTVKTDAESKLSESRVQAQKYLEEHILALETRMEKDFKSRFVAIVTSVLAAVGVGVLAAIASLQNNLLSAQNAVRDAKKELLSAEADVAKMSSEIGAKRDEFKTLVAEVGASQQKLATSNTALIQEMNTAYDAFQKRLKLFEANETKLHELLAKTGTVETRLNTLEQNEPKLQELLLKTGTVEARLRTLEQNAQSDARARQERIATLQEKIPKLEEHLKDNLSDHARGLNTHELVIARDELAALKKREEKP